MRIEFLCKTVKARVFFFLLLFVNISLNAQTNLITELSGDPLDLSEWTTNGVDIEGEEIVLTQAAEDEKGALFYAQPYGLNQCVKWKIEFDFRMYDGNEHADGLAFFRSRYFR